MSNKRVRQQTTSPIVTKLMSIPYNNRLAALERDQVNSGNLNFDSSSGNDSEDEKEIANQRKRQKLTNRSKNSSYLVNKKISEIDKNAILTEFCSISAKPSIYPRIFVCGICLDFSKQKCKKCGFRICGIRKCVETHKEINCHS